MPVRPGSGGKSVDAGGGPTIGAVAVADPKTLVEPLARLARLSADHLDAWRTDSEPDQRLVGSFVDDLGAAATSAGTVQVGSEGPVRGLAHAPTVIGQAIGQAGAWPLLDAAIAAFGIVRWTEFYAEDDWSRGFVGSFANGEGIGPDGRVHSDRVIVGLFLLGPNTLYPPHAHPAEEFYIPLVGEAEFEVGAHAGHELVRPGDVVLHHSNVSHSIRTGASPSLSVFGWRGDLHARSWYRPDMADESTPVQHPTIRKS